MEARYSNLTTTFCIIHWTYKQLLKLPGFLGLAVPPVHMQVMHFGLMLVYFAFRIIVACGIHRNISAEGGSLQHISLTFYTPNTMTVTLRITSLSEEVHFKLPPHDT